MEESIRKKVLLGTGCGQITEKKSRFIANCYEVHSEDEALKIIEDLRKKFWDARHNCYAYIIGRNNETVRFSDDKEPQGTAGKPILEVLSGNRLYNTLIVVTRYFGGVLLGTGGLVRAYSAAAAEGIKNSILSEVYSGCQLTITCDYSAVGKLQHLFSQTAEYGVCSISDTLYGQDVRFLLVAETALTDSLAGKITEATAGQANIQIGPPFDFALSGGRPVKL